MNLANLRVRLLGAAWVGLLLAEPSVLLAQGAISGRVTDRSSGQPIAAARVTVVGTALVAQTNADGRYTVPGVPAGTQTVRAAALGYAAVTQTVTVAAGETVAADLQLTFTPFTLDEQVVTATGDEARRAVGNSMATIKADSLVPLRPITSMNDLLVAKAAGVQVLPGNLTGAGARVRIRGTNSLSLNNEPIYVIDGIRMESAVNSSSIGIGGTNPSRVNDINPDEIESIDIVKGPSAAALYGTAAVNGVIVIKTKRGRPGPARWNVYSELGIIKDYNDYPDAYRGWAPTSTATNTTQCFLTSSLRAAGDPLRCQQDSVTRFDLFKDPGASPLGTGWRGQVGAQVSGGSESASYFLSGEYEDERGVLRMPGFAYGRVLESRQISEVPYEQYRPNARMRVSVRANVQASVSPKLDLAGHTNFISSSQRLPQTDNNTTGLLSNALGGKGNKDTVMYGYRAFTPDQFFSETVTQDINRFIGSGTANWRPTSWLALRGIGGVDFTSRVDTDLCRRGECTDFNVTNITGFKEDNRRSFFEYTLDLNAAATFQITPAIRSRTTLGVQYFQSVFHQNGAFGEDLPPGASTVTPGAILDADEVNDEEKTLGVFVEQTFSRNDRLFVTGALRRDDNSAFGENFAAVYYPKFSVSWVISEEPFFSPPSWLSSLRLRGAIGAAGQQPEPTEALRFFSPVAASVENTDSPALIFTAIGNPDLKPERAREIELGFDAAFFDSRVSLDFTFYHKRTKDALIARVLPPSAGASVDRFENIGAVRNSGVELSLNAMVFNSPRFGWDLILNGSYNSNKIESMGGVPPIKGTTIWEIEGYPVISYWQIPYTYSDVDGNGVITANEVVTGDTAVFVGQQNPKAEISASTGFDFFNRKLRVTGLFDFKGGHYQLNGSDRIRCESRGNCDGLIDRNAPLWKQARVVALRETAARTQYGFIEKADFLRFRELSVTYTIPDAWARAMRAERVSVTLAGRNLFKVTDYSGMDPESNYFTENLGIVSDFQTQPPPTYWTMRVNIGF